MDKKVVFIMGPGHCGSTLLDLLLGSHSQSFSLGELHRIGGLVAGPSEGYRKICGVCVGECELWNKRMPLSFLRMYFARENKLQAGLSKVSHYTYNPYKLIARWSGKSLLIDSSKGAAWIERRLHPSYTWHGIKPYLIYMCRDGRAVVNSYYRKYPEQGIANVIQKWKQQTDTMNAFFIKFPHEKMKVQYEELATRPERVVRALCGFLNIEYEEAMLRYWTHEHHHLMGNGGTRSLIFKYREKLGINEEALRNRREEAKQFYDASYYDEMELGIHLDERWRVELSREHRECFDMLAGDTNKSLDYGREERQHHE
jgi:hypothetical protein